MASKQDLVAEAEEYAKALGEPVKTEGLNHAELSALVADLGKRFADGKQGAPEAPGAAPAAPAPPAPPAKVVGDADPDSGKPPKPKAAAVKFPLQVAPGKCVTHGRARKGALTQGERVLETDFPPETLALLVRKGVVLDNRSKS